MTFRGDDRAVTVQIGAVLLFATLIVAMSMYQATVVPQQNAGAEYDHGQRVQNDMLDLRNAILRSAATGTSQPTSVAVGMRYPNRLMFVNPPAPAGTLRTAEVSNVSISATHVGNEETGQYWNGTHTFETASLVYEPDYNGYSNAPTTVYESSLLYNEFDGGANVTLSDQTMIDGDRITLVTLDGSLSQSRAGSVSVDPRALSPSSMEYRTLPVRSDSEVTITVPTRLDAATWKQEIVDDELDESGTNPTKHVHDVVPNGENAVDIVLEPGEYDLRLAKVGIGSGAEDEGAAYITDVSGDGRTVREGSSVTLVAEVRDRFNNPVSGVQVSGSSPDVGSLTPIREMTDGTGRAVFRYDAPTFASNVMEDQDTTVFLTCDDNDTERERARFDLTVENVGTGNNGGGGGGDNGGSGNGNDAANDVEYVTGSGLAKANGGPTSGAQFKIRNNGTDSVEITEIMVETRRSNAPKGINEQGGAVSGNGQNEIYIDATTPGYLEMGGRRDSVDPGATYDLGARESLTEDAQLAAGSEATLYMYEFKKQNGGAQDMSDVEVTVTLYFADGSSKEITFTAEYPWG